MTSREYEYQLGMQSNLRVIQGARPENALKVIEQMTREIAGYVAAGGIDFQVAVDCIQGTAQAAGWVACFGQDAVQAAIAAGMPAPVIDNAPSLVPDLIDDSSAPAKHPKGKILVSQRASEIVSRPIDWLWPKRIALGKLTLIAGVPGLGKSQFTAFLAAAVTASRPLPCDEGLAPQGSVFLLSAEDDAADTIKPRLDAAGADASRVVILSSVHAETGAPRRTFSLQSDLDVLEGKIAELGDVRLVVIDPISSYMGKVDSHRNTDVRAVLEPLGEMAARLRVAIVAVTHQSKGKAKSALDSVIDSIGYTATSRASYLIANDPHDDGRRIFVKLKNNLAPEKVGLAFRISELVVGDDILAPAIEWEATPVHFGADEIYDAREQPSFEKSQAEEFLRELLAGGELAVNEIRSAAGQAGVSWPSVNRAKKKLGISAIRKPADPADITKGGHWVWAFPPKAINPA